MSVFKPYLRSYILLLLIPLALGCLGRESRSSNLKSQGYSILIDANQGSEKWGEYLFRHLSHRCKEKGVVVKSKKNDDVFLTINFGVDKAMGYDYTVECTGKKLTLKAKDSRTALWLIYQLISQLANHDDRFDASDLPPAILDFHTCKASFDFSYREPFFYPNLKDENSSILGTNFLERDWGIWGHNLGKVLQGSMRSSIYSTQSNWNGVDDVQYCFSSKEMFKQLEQYITDNFGDGKDEPQRFMIMPNDNLIACVCPLCLDKGNTPDNATPAVSRLIERLAARFPNHMFFTSAYLTTKLPPEKKLPANTGVLISTIDIPKGIDLNEQNKAVADFLRTLKQWKTCTSNIYIWDYAANFDDYLTPIPVLEGLKKQLAFYKSKGVNGVFLNASGYDYAPFDDVKTFVAGSLMMDGSLPVDSLCEMYFDKFYPKTGKYLCDYYLYQEKEFAHKKQPYDLYGGFDETLKTYLDAQRFMKLYNSFDSLIAMAGGEERKKLEKLYTALSYTRLQIAYHQRIGLYGFAVQKEKELVVKPELKVIMDRLLQYKKYGNLLVYREVGGNLDLYLNSWNKIYKENTFKNLLIAEPIRVLSQQDEDYTSSEMLNDGVVGFANDYHQGWYLCSVDDLLVRFDTQNIKKAKQICMRFLVDEKHRIYPPSKIELYKDDVLYKEIKEAEGVSQYSPNVLLFREDVSVSDAKAVTVKIYRKSGSRNTLACDEIQLN